ncbi:MAG: prepilin peptidase [Longimicrobiaceae bacterium]
MPFLNPFAYLLAALVGASVGSFLNVCVYRLPRGESVVNPGSRCPGCGYPVRWHDNLPVFGYLALRGRCRDCGGRISPRYPLVEIATAALWVAAVALHGVGWEGLASAVLFTLLLGIALTDAASYTIPDLFTWGGLALGLALAWVRPEITFWQSLGGAALGFGLLFMVGVVGEWLFRKPAMGGGDIKMMAMVGSFLGPVGVVLTIFLGALLGTLIFTPITLVTKKLVPFGIFLALGGLGTAVWGDALIGWYLRTLWLG